MSEPENKPFELKVVHTSCRDCTFANYDGKTQVGCLFGGRLDRFRRQNPDCVVEAKDGEREFFLLNGRRCTAFRPHGWRKEDERDDAAYARARRELTVRVDFLVLVDGDFTEKDFKKTLDSVRRQDPPARSLVAVHNAVPSRLPLLNSLLTRHAAGLDWFLTSVCERNEDGSPVDRLRAVDIGVDKVRAHFYCLLTPGGVVPDDFTRRLDRAVTDDLARFVVVRPGPDRQGLTVSLGFHRQAEGNRTTAVAVGAEQLDAGEPPAEPVRYFLTGVVAKAEYFARAHEIPYLVVSRKEL